MARNTERGLENLVQESERMIRDLELITGLKSSGHSLSERMKAELDPQATVPLEPFAEPSIDGSVEIAVAQDAMTVNACFHPPSGNGAPLSLDSVRDSIENMRIAFGIDWEAVKGCILTCNEERIEIADVVIARGRKARNERPPYLVLNEELVNRLDNNSREEAKVDFKELSLFTLIKMGDVLATLMPKQEGVMGMTVLGTTAAFAKEPVSYPKPGKNTEWREQNVIAKCAGRLQVTGDSFWVDEILDIQGNVDFHVGNLDFPGDVVIRGEILDGFSVKAGKSILCTGCIGAARIECGGDLVTQQGVLGKEKAVILVGGAVEAKFVEFCAIDAGGPIRIKTSVLNSTVHTKDRLEMGNRGIIIGGIVKAQNGVSAAQIGTERGPRTEIHCGIDFKVEQKLIWIRDRNIALAFKLREIDARAKTSEHASQVLAPLREKIKASIHELNENARTLVSGLDRNEEADVSIREIVFPGTYVEICHISYFITHPRKSVTLKLDKSQGRIKELSWMKSRITPVTKKSDVKAPSPS